MICGVISSQPTEQWVKRYNSPTNSNDFGRYIAVDNSGNVIVTGDNQLDITTVKYSPTGNEMWAKVYSTSGIDIVRGILTDNNGNIIIAGVDFQTSTDVFIQKYDAAGNSIWLQRYNGNDNLSDNIGGLTSDANGNCYISGISSKTGGTYDLITIKYNSSGVMQWTNKTGISASTVNEMKLDPAGNIYICGGTDVLTSNRNAFLAKVSNTGTLLFLQTYNYGAVVGEDYFVSIGINSTGSDIYVTGMSYGGPAAGRDYVTLKYNSSGIQQWVQRYNGPGSRDDEPVSLVIDSAGNVYSAGRSDGGASTDIDVAITKYSSSGVPLGFQRYNVGNNSEGAVKIKIDAVQNLYVVGYTNGDVLILKYNSALTLLWAKTYNSPANDDDGPSDEILDNSGNIYIIGVSRGIGTNYDYLTIKYSQVVGINQISTGIPDKFSLSQNYPNPFNPATNIKCDIPKASVVKITVYDMLGREVQVLANEFRQAGSYEINFDASELSSGTYFYKITAGDYSDIKKMVLIK